MILQILNSEQIQVLKDLTPVFCIVIFFLMLMWLSLRKPNKKYRSYYRLKKKHESLRLYLAEEIGCEQRPDSLNRIPYNSIFGACIRELKLEKNFEIVEEEI
jgi:hypothetical protein